MLSSPNPFMAMGSDMSLARRLLVGAAIWSVVVLVAGAVTLTAVFRAQTVSLLDEELDSTLATLAGAFDVGPDGELSYEDRRMPSDPRFQIALSGRYWAIVALGGEGAYGQIENSPSVWDGEVPWPEDEAAQLLEATGARFRRNGTGPNDEPIRVAAQVILAGDEGRPFLLVAASDRQSANRSASRFTLFLVVAFGMLAAGVLAAMWISVRAALVPLRRIEADVADVREGRKTKLAEDYPSEVRPLSEELNKLLDHNRSVVERAQTHVGNLAHALKTPLAVLVNEAKGESALDDIVRRQTAAMHDNVQHYLQRARAAARAETLGARAELRPVLDGLARMLNRLYAEKGVTVSVTGGKAAVFRGEAQDLQEMLGNLMENACKWAASRVEVAVVKEKGAILVEISDDGPGLTPGERAEAMKRGVRLDETAPGTGLGLSIVKELAELYNSAFELAESRYGGLKAVLKLQSA